MTEILYALGLENRVIAVDTTSLYPARALAEKPNVGYMRQLSAEGVLGLAPSLVLAADGSGPKETIAVLEAARDARSCACPTSFTGEGIVEKIRLIAAGDRRRRRAANASPRRSRPISPRSRRCASASQRRCACCSCCRSSMGGRWSPAAPPPPTASSGSPARVNAITEFEGYKMVNDEAVVAARPDAVLVDGAPAACPLDAEQVFEHPAFALTPAARASAFISMEGLYLLGFGPRTAHAARDLALALYPSLATRRCPPSGRDSLPEQGDLPPMTAPRASTGIASRRRSAWRHPSSAGASPPCWRCSR